MNTRFARTWLGVLGACLAAGGTGSAAEAASSGTPAATPPPAVTLPHSQRLSFPSVATGYTYDVQVFLPAEYAQSGRSYPVLYVVDGWHGPLMASIVDKFPFSPRVPPMIVVVIGYGADSEVMQRRALDYLPTRAGEPPEGGGANRFVEFLQTELLPAMETRYRATPGDRAFLGHSYGGVLALHLLVSRPALFPRLVIASPSLYWDDQKLLKQVAAGLPETTVPVRAALIAGGVSDNLRETTALAGALQDKPVKGLTWNLQLFPEEDHVSVAHAGFPAALSWLFADRPRADGETAE